MSSHLIRTDVSEGHPLTSPAPATGHREAAITSSADQQKYPAAKSSDGNLPADFAGLNQFNIITDLADNQARQSGKNGLDKAQAAGGAVIQDLVYRYQENPLEKGFPDIIANFDSITEKMSRILHNPDIASRHKISLLDLDQLAKNPEFKNGFSESELNSLELLRSEGYRQGLFGLMGERAFTKEQALKIGHVLGILIDA